MNSRRTLRHEIRCVPGSRGEPDLQTWCGRPLPAVVAGRSTVACAGCVREYARVERMFAELRGEQVAA